MSKRGLIALAILALGVLALVIVQGQAWMFDRDFFTYWGGGRGLLEGENLYDSAVWRDITRVYGSTWFPNPIFIYAPPTAIFFAPLAALPVPIAAFIWVWLSEIFVALAVVLITDGLGWTRFLPIAPFWGIAIFLFMPVLLTLLMGQASALLLILVVLAATLWERGAWLRGGLLLGMTIVKPQPVVLLIPLVALWLLWNRRWRGLVGLSASLGASALATAFLSPTFLQDWQAAAVTKVGGVAVRMPTLWGLTADLFGGSSLAVAGGVALTLLVVGASVLLVVRWRAPSAFDLIGALLVFSLLATPYLWNYDQILLLMPFLVALIRIDRRASSFGQVVLLPFVFDILAIVFFVIASVRLRDGLSVLLSLFVGGMLWFALLNQSAPGEEPV